MSRIYLSIDLDYWLSDPNGVCVKLGNHSVPDAGMIGFLNKAIDLEVPTKVVRSHEQLLSHVNRSKADTLFNVDHHADLTDIEDYEKKPEDFEEGTWANFVSFRKNGTFLWLYPIKTCFITERGALGTGRCDTDKSPFTKKCMDVCGWKEVKRRQRKLLTNEEWKQVVRVGISISPEWIDGFIAEEAIALLKKRKIIPQKLIKEITEEFEDCGFPLTIIIDP